MRLDIRKSIEEFMADDPNRPTLTDEEFTILALTIHGAFFERKCQHIVHQAKAWQIQETDYPVYYGGANSNLDIWAKQEDGIGIQLVLPIECKKNNPDFINWVFFRQPSHRPAFSIMQIIQVRQQATPSIWGGYRELQRLYHDLPITDEARETKGDYKKIKLQDRTRTSNTAITDAATQIAIATQALIQQEQTILDEMSRPPGNKNKLPPYNQLFIFPTIVTTAKLLLCEFEDTDVDLSTGVIPLEKAKLVPCPYLIFDFPIPSGLQLVPNAIHLGYTADTLKQLARMPIFIVHSEAFPRYLERLSRPLSYAQDSVRCCYELHLRPEVH